MKDLFNHWEEARQRLSRPDKVLWLFDFDGTLAPIARRPTEASMPGVVRGLLRKLVRRFPQRVGIISGRPISLLVRKTDIRGLIYSGTHGFEIRGLGKRWQRAVPVARLKDLSRLRTELQSTIRDIPGLRIENKKWTVAVHYREITPKERARAAAVILHIRHLAACSGFKVQEGLKAIEILSDAHWNKGRAVRRLRRLCRPPTVFYLGDDATDETVFRTMKQSDVSVHVGHRGLWCAQYALRQQRNVPDLLRRILML